MAKRSAELSKLNDAVAALSKIGKRRAKLSALLEQLAVEHERACVALDNATRAIVEACKNGDAPAATGRVKSPRQKARRDARADREPVAAE